MGNRNRNRESSRIHVFKSDSSKKLHKENQLNKYQISKKTISICGINNKNTKRTNVIRHETHKYEKNVYFHMTRQKGRLKDLE